MMRRLISLSFLWLFVLSTSLTIPSAPLFAAETGIFESTSYDFKGIPRYTKPRHSFIFTNPNDDVLRLVAARTSCQCTQVYVPDKREFKKGEKGEVVAEIDAVRFTGARHATLTLTFEQSGRVFEIPLNIVGMVIENVKITPSHLDFLVDEFGGDSGTTSALSDASQLDAPARSRIVTVQYPSNETAVKATSSSPYIDVQIGKTTRSTTGSVVPLMVSVSKDAPAGYIDATVSIWSNGASHASPLTLDVLCVVRAPLMVSPPTLTFFTSPDGEKITKNIVVSASSPFTLKEVVSDSESINVKISPRSIRTSKVCVVPVSFDPSKLRDESGAAHLQVRTTDGRVLNLNAQISSGNFEAMGLVQKQEILPEIDETFAAEENSNNELASSEKTSSGTSESKTEVKIADASEPSRESTNSAFQTPRVKVNSKYSSSNGALTPGQYRSGNTYQTPPKTSLLPSSRSTPR